MFKFNEGGWEPPAEWDDPVPPKPVPRFAPKVIAGIRGRPLNDFSKDRKFDDEFRPPTVKAPSKPKKKSMNFTLERKDAPALEAGSAPEGIQSTKDYSLFKLLPTNRPVDQAHVRKLASAIRQKNLLHLNPIVVNDRMEVIEGQHRLAAAELCSVSIFFAQDSNVSQDDIAALNSNKKNWALMDYLHFYAEKGNPDYQTFLELCRLNPDIQASALLSMCAAGTKKGGYKVGQLDISAIDSARETIKYLADYKAHFQYATSSRFIEALSFIARTGLYDHGHMLKKLEANPGMLQPCANAKDYIIALQRIYNKNIREENIVTFLKRY